jgi:hypothetical protein
MENEVFTNMLINESSPYLLQHARNPVNWYPWGSEALEKAKTENRLIIVSIGYSACHWCHVMEHESFEDKQVASLMNDRFVSIKVDREERPDIDHIYMNAVQILTGSGGWPLNVITLPDGRPVFGGTYFRKEQWLSVLTQVSDYYISYPEKTIGHAENLTNGIKSGEMFKVSSPGKELEREIPSDAFRKILEIIDPLRGGLKGAPKFPLPVCWQFLLYHYYQTGNKDALDAVKLTLDKMSAGGIYDHIGGGFARYSTDADWHVPHFEKMLYDNAQLVSLYSHAYQVTRKRLYRDVVYETLDFIGRELTSPEGFFYSSLDADSEGEEGKYYTWEKEEVDQILGNHSDLINQYYNVTREGNWEEGKNIPFRASDPEEFSSRYDKGIDKFLKIISDSGKKLLDARKKRIPPQKDDKVLASWNGLMIKAYADAYRVFNEERFLGSAIRCGNLIIEKMTDFDGRLNRSYKNGKASINGFLDDYAFMIDAFVSLYRASFDEKWLTWAYRLSEYAVGHFSDSRTGMFYYTSDIDPPLVARISEYTDSVVPASNSMMAVNLNTLGTFFRKDSYIERAYRMAATISSEMAAGGPYYANWAILYSLLLDPPAEVVIIGKEASQKRKEFDELFLPGLQVSGGEEEGTLPLHKDKLKPGQTLIYVCRNRTCGMPVTETRDALQQLRK